MQVDTNDLIDSPEVARMLELASFRAISTYRKRYETFPAPVIEKGRCVLWSRADVEAWARETGRS